MPEYEEILYDVSDRVATITINRPEKMNAFTPVVMEEMIDAFDVVDADDDVRAVIVTGAGRAFCAGAELSSAGSAFAPSGAAAATGAADTDPNTPSVTRDGGGILALRIFEARKPVIAAINGAAVGVGITMTLPMDIRLASTKAKVGLVFARRGVIPEACSTWFLPRLVGIDRALEWIYSGRVFGADEALAGGLVRSVHEPDDLLPAARAIAAEIAEQTAPVSIALTRQMMWRNLGAPHPMDAHRAESRGLTALRGSADRQEGIQSFLDKRPPAFVDTVGEMPDVFPDWVDPPFE